MHVDVSRAYFHAKAQRPVLAKLPAEDCSGKGVRNGLLKKSMYGTRDAASNWDRDWFAGAQFKNPVPQPEKENFGFDTRTRLCGDRNAGSLLEVKKQLGSVYPIKASILGAGFDRHVDVLVESLLLENGNTVQTPTIDDVDDENPVWLQQVQISRGLVLVPQTRQGRHDVRRERALPENVRSYTTQLFEIEATRSVPEGRETMDPSFRIRGHEFRSDSFLGLKGWRKRNG